MSNRTSRSLILGLGQTGLSLFNYLRKFEQEPLIFDTRDNPPCKKELLKKSKNNLIISNLKEIAFDEIRSCYMSPGFEISHEIVKKLNTCLLYISPSPRDATLCRMPSSA